MGNIVKLIYNQLESDKNCKELLLESLLNSDITTRKHFECIEVLKEIASIKECLNVMDGYLNLDISGEGEIK